MEVRIGGRLARSPWEGMTTIRLLDLLFGTGQRLHGVRRCDGDSLGHRQHRERHQQPGGLALGLRDDPRRRILRSRLHSRLSTCRISAAPGTPWKAILQGTRTASFIWTASLRDALLLLFGQWDINWASGVDPKTEPPHSAARSGRR